MKLTRGAMSRLGDLLAGTAQWGEAPEPKARKKRKKKATSR
jgi:hypothetical protein